MATGTVKWFDPEKGFGFIVNEDGVDVFIHYTEIAQEGFRCLRTGQEVKFTLVDADKGFQGKGVTVVSDGDSWPPKSQSVPE